MRPDSTFINSARGAVVREEEMIEAAKAAPRPVRSVGCNLSRAARPGVGPLYAAQRDPLAAHRWGDEQRMPPDGAAGGGRITPLLGGPALAVVHLQRALGCAGLNQIPPGGSLYSSSLPLAAVCSCRRRPSGSGLDAGHAIRSGFSFLVGLFQAAPGPGGSWARWAHCCSARLRCLGGFARRNSKKSAGARVNGWGRKTTCWTLHCPWSQ